MSEQSTGNAAQATHAFDPTNIHDPQVARDIYGELRKCPVAHTTPGGDLYWLTRYDDVKAAALDSERFSSARQGVFFPALPEAPRGVVLEMDPPEHAPWRRLYMEAMAPDRLRAVEPRMVDITNGLIDSFAGKGRCELMEDFAGPLPVLGICALIGVDGLEVDKIREISSHFSDSLEARIDTIGRLGRMLLDEVLIRRKDPRDDYLTYLATAQPVGKLLNEEEIIQVTSGFLTAGHESTTSALGSLLVHVLSDANLKPRLSADEKLINGAIEETVRLHPSFHAFHRTTTEPVEVAGVTIPEDSTVRLCWASANQDASVFERPDEFIADRKPNTHVGFGFGRHVCVGAPFARLEMRIAVRELLRRLPDIHLTEAPQWFMPDSILERPRPYHAAFTPSPG